VRSANQVDFVAFDEVVQGLLAEHLAHAAVGLLVLVGFEGGVAPEQVVGHFVVLGVEWALDFVDVHNVFEFGRDAPVHAQNALVDQCGNGHPVEHVVELLPQFDVLAPFALVEEALLLVDAGRLVITAQQEEGLGLDDLVDEEQRDDLDRLHPAVHLVTQKKEIAVRRFLEDREYVIEVLELPVDVSQDVQRRLELQQHRLPLEYVPDQRYHQLDVLQVYKYLLLSLRIQQLILHRLQLLSIIT